MRASLVVVSLVVVVAVSRAADHPLAGDRLVLRDPAAKPKHRAVVFKANKDRGLDAGHLPDPRTAGATVEVRGTGTGDGAAGPIALDAGHWKGLGNPPGSKGWKWLDKTRSRGMRSVVLRSSNAGGTLGISGGGSAWPYAVTQPQSAIRVAVTIDGDTWCAQFGGTFAKNKRGVVHAKHAPAPAGCSPPQPAACGDGVLDGAEDCDDGNTSSGDGCSATCTIESAAGLCAGVPTTAGTALGRAQLVVDGLTMPTHATAPPLDPHRLFVVEQGGRIRIIEDGVLLPTPFLDLSGAVSCCGERGLLSLAFHPDYRSNGAFFVDYTNTAGDTEVRRFRVSADPDVADASSSALVIQIAQDFPNHNGGQLAFGPDGYLYVGMGDGGGGGDPNERAQDPGQLLGKILRLDVNGAPYAIPPTNPFAGPGLPLDEIWALGLRNPWRFSFDRATGDLYIADVGQGAWEEVDVQPASSAGGENYGWDVFEGNACSDPPPLFPACPAPTTGFTFPVLVFGHDPACSITGGFVYRGCAMPDLRGTYFYSDYCANFVRTFSGVSGGVARNEADRTGDVRPPGGFDGVVSFAEDARGELYVLEQRGGGSDAGRIWKIVPGP